MTTPSDHEIRSESFPSFPEKLSAFDTSFSDSQGQPGLKSFTEAFGPYHKRPVENDQINLHVRYWQYL